MLASPFSVLAQSYRLYRANLWILVGYSAWLLFPIAGIYALSFMPEHTWVSYVSAGIFTIAQILISIWLSILLILIIDLIDRKSNEAKSGSINQQVDLLAIQKQSVLLLHPSVRVMARQLLFVLLGLIMFIIPGIVMAIWYAFSQLSVVLDGKRDMEALHFSKSLVKGRIFPVLYRLIAGPFIVGLVYSILIAILFSFIAVFSGFDLISVMTGDNVPAWMNLLQSSLEIFTIPLIATYMVMLYKELKKKNEIVE